MKSKIPTATFLSFYKHFQAPEGNKFINRWNQYRMKQEDGKQTYERRKIYSITGLINSYYNLICTLLEKPMQNLSNEIKNYQRGNENSIQILSLRFKLTHMNAFQLSGSRRFLSWSDFKISIIDDESFLIFFRNFPWIFLLDFFQLQVFSWCENPISSFFNVLQIAK